MKWPRLPLPMLILSGLILITTIASLTSVFALTAALGSLKKTPSPVIIKKQTLWNDKIVVDIEGAVEKPGVYELSRSSRLINALKTAGGLSEYADRFSIAKSLNLAKSLTSEEKIYIPFKTESESVADELINVNTASQTELELLPNVGEVTAGKIIEGRPYLMLEELVSKKAIGPKTLEKIYALITL